MAYKKSKFFTPRTAGFINKVSREYIRSMGQTVLYYKLNTEKSDYSDEYERLFRESRKKFYSTPESIECSVFINEKNTENFRDVGYEVRTAIDVYFEREVLKKHDISPSIGDVISFQDTFFRVFDTDDTSMYHGNPRYKYSIVLNAVDMRLNNNENPLKSDEDYYYEDENQRNPVDFPDLPDGYSLLLDNVKLFKDSESEVTSTYENDFNNLLVNVKLKIDEQISDVTHNDSEFFMVFNENKDTKQIIPNENDISNVQIEDEYLILEFNFNVNSKYFSQVDKLYFFFKEQEEFEHISIAIK